MAGLKVTLIYIHVITRRITSIRTLANYFKAGRSPQALIFLGYTAWCRNMLLETQTLFKRLDRWPIHLPLSVCYKISQQRMALPWGVAADTNAEAQRSAGERTGLAAELGIMGGARIEVRFGCSSACDACGYLVAW